MSLFELLGHKDEKSQAIEGHAMFLLILLLSRLLHEPETAFLKIYNNTYAE